MGSVVTRTPAVVDALVALFKAATGLQVLDGPEVGEVAQEAICVGLPSDQGRPGYESEVTRQDGYGPARYVEEWTVSSMLALSYGENDIKTLRTRAGAFLEDVATALRDAGETDAWQVASLGGALEWVPVRDANGSTVVVFFTVVGSSLL